MKCYKKTHQVSMPVFILVFVSLMVLTAMLSGCSSNQVPVNPTDEPSASAPVEDTNPVEDIEDPVDTEPVEDIEDPVDTEPVEEDIQDIETPTASQTSSKTTVPGLPNATISEDTVIETGNETVYNFRTEAFAGCGLDGTVRDYELYYGIHAETDGSNLIYRAYSHDETVTPVKAMFMRNSSRNYFNLDIAYTDNSVDLSPQSNDAFTLFVVFSNDKACLMTVYVNDGKPYLVERTEKSADYVRRNILPRQAEILELAEQFGVTPENTGKDTLDKQTYQHIPFHVAEWRAGKNLPKKQGLVLGCVGKKNAVTALVDTDDIHCLMIGASGVGKTAFFLYPNMEYACASGMSFLALDTKGDLARNYGAVASQHYGYKVAVIDLRNPTKSDGYNLLTLINRYMDICREQPSNLAARAKAEKYAKILAKTIINPEGDASNYGQNAFFYDAAEGLLTAVILLLAEYLPPTEEAPQERRHIVSVFKLVQDLLAPSKTAKGKNGFQILMDSLPDTHKARWFAGAALNSAEQAMASVMSTVLSRLNAFLDSELEQVLCFDSAIDAELFASRKSAIFLVLPEEDPSKNFMAGLMIQTLSRELFSVADENGGKLPNRVVLFCDELGTMPAFDILPLFSAGRSRKLTLVPIIQSLAQLEKNYGKEGAEIIVDNTQDTIFGGFAPNSQTAEVLSKALGSRTVMSGSVSKGGGKDSASRSLQMMERPLMTPDELKSIPKGQFVVMKTGTHPMQTRLRLFLDWGISFGDPYLLPERAARTVAYASKQELEQAIFRCHHAQQMESEMPPAPSVPPKTPAARGGVSYAQARRTRRESPAPVVVRTDGGQE